MRYQIWYMKPEFFRDGITGYRWLANQGKLPTKARLADTHAHLIDIEARGLDEVFIKMQGERWSPNGEARPLIEQLGLQHTSMSSGDIAVELSEGGKAYLCDIFGWRDIS